MRYCLELGDISHRQLGLDWYPLGAWCFVGCEDKYPNWSDQYDFPRTYDNKKLRENDYNLCSVILSQIFPTLIDEYKVKFQINEPLPDSFFVHILRPSLIKTIAMVLGKYRYITKFLAQHSDKEFVVIKPDFYELDASTDLLLKRQIHPWINYEILNYLTPKNITFLSANTHSTYDSNLTSSIQYSSPELQSFKQKIISSIRTRCKLFRGVYGVTLIQQVIIEFLLRVKLPKKNNNRFSENKTHLLVDDELFTPQFLKFIRNICLKSIPKPIGHNFLNTLNDQKHELKLFLWVKGRLLVDRTALHDETRIVFHALWIHAGGRIAFAQHGSAYEGYKNHYASEFYEFLGDAFFTWGWRRKEGIESSEILISAPSFELSCYKKQHKEVVANLIYVGTATSAYFDGILYSEALDINLYRKSKLTFLKGIHPSILSATLYRQHPSRHVTEFEDYDWLVKRGLSIKQSLGSLFPVVLKSRLVVVDYYGTIFFQCMAWNIPVVLYFGGEDYNLCPNFLRMLERLKLVGIFHTSAESARDFVNDNFSDVSEWWNKSDVQNLRQEFCAEFANTSDSCLMDWMKLLWRV